MQPFKPFLALVFFLFALSFTSQAQLPVKNYEKEWKSVDDLIIIKNLPKSALAEVKKIYAFAKRDKQDAQLIKAVVYMTALQRETREENEAATIKEIEKEIATAKEPVISVLKSLSAEIYLNYYNQHRWQLYGRSETTQFKKDDISTWSIGDFHKKISSLFLQSLQNEKQLQQTKLEPWEAIIIKGNVRHLRPTLYDLLAHRALDYFKSDDIYLDKPAYAFELDKAAVFDPAPEFATIIFNTKDTASLQYKALIIYQKLIALHLKDKQPDALLDADIDRLEFVHNKSVHEDKEDLYKKSLNHIIQQHGDRPAASQASYLLAVAYNQDADEYTPYGDTAHRYDKLKAIAIIDRVLRQKDSSEGKINCQNLFYTITRQNLSFSLEKVNIPGKPFRTLIDYRNIEQLQLRIINVHDSIKDILGNNYLTDKNWQYLLNEKPVRAWQQNLPITKDYQQHSTELKIDALPAGEYILLASSDNFRGKAVLGARSFYVSNISFLNQDENYFVLHRDSGKPLPGATVKVWEQLYDQHESRYTKQNKATYTTDNNGFFKLLKQKKVPGINNFLFDITYNDDHLFMNDWMYDYYYYRSNEEKEDEGEKKIFFFTDRSIYRPGQTVYFKGIMVSGDQKRKNNVVEGFKTKLFLEDANGDDVDSITVTTNEYGSFSGEFLLPSFGLNGDFTIYDEDDFGTVEFSVEEYKRPKFYVEFEPIKGTFKLNEKIKVTGNAKAYAGNNIDGALVKYRVERQARFPYPWMFYGWRQPRSTNMNLTHGEAKTDKDGKFSIEFDAIPDKSIDKKSEPVFDYVVYADVTDINGESRSGETSISVGYKSILLNTSLPGKMPADSLKNIYISTENMAGEFEPALATVTFTRLKDEKRLIRKRYWARPDQFVMSKEEYLQYFPNDEYDNESDPKNREKGEIIFQGKDSTTANGKWKIDNKRFAPGFYIAEISAHAKNGEEVKDIIYVELYDENDSQINSPVYLWTQYPKPIEPGEKTEVIIGSSATDLYIIRQTEKKNITGPEFQYMNLSNEKKSISYSATEEDRGGYTVNFFFVKNNRAYYYSPTIRVPWSNKQLHIEYATFRDKTLPGSEEKWKVKISGNKKEKVAAEMLGSMYDASLDQFKDHQWYTPSIWQESYYYADYSSHSGQTVNFQQITSIQKWVPVPQLTLNKVYDKLIPTGEIIMNNLKQKYIRYKRESAQKQSDSVSFRLSLPENEELHEVVVTAYRMQKKQNLTAAFSSLTESSISVNMDDLPDLIDTVENIKPQTEIQVRKNFNETAFFLPDLKTDENGDIEFSFTMPEALTRWKFQAMTHTKDLAFGYSQKEIVTQKQLMVQPNPPRFLREGDKMEFSAKIVNMTDKEVTGQVELQLFDAATNESVSGWFRNMFPNQYFTVAAGQSEVAVFPIEVPFLFNKALSWRIVARSGDVSDGEEAAMPVLTNRMLVTETLPLYMKGPGTKNFSFTKLLNAGESESIQHHALTFEYTTNPAWYAVQVLPYLMEFPYECAEQTWNRFYANAIATKIAGSSPRIREIFDSWNIKDTAALLSNLQKNPELKAVLLEETPWVLAAKTEAQQKKNIALLFDMVRMSKELKATYEKLQQKQNSNGGFVWFEGGPDNPYITQYIVTGIGHLKKLVGDISLLEPILKKAIPYLDKQIVRSYDDLKRFKVDLKTYSPGQYEIQYLYMRSFFPEIKIPDETKAAYNYFSKQVQLNWIKQSKYMQGMIALISKRKGNDKAAADILRSLKETSITNDELGMYWKENSGGWFWYQAPIETQALLIEAFNEAGNDIKAVNAMRTWLLKNKQTNNWKTTKATAEACYSLLLNGSLLLDQQPEIEIRSGSNNFSSSENKQEAGTGYFKKTIDGPLVTTDMGNISVTQYTTGDKATTTPTWGAVYWQYFEDLDKITVSSTPLSLNKKLFVETNTDNGPVLTPVNEWDVLKVGDKIKVRIELKADRDMEYVHMKDMRASCLEPVNVLSSYKWQGGLGYYESTKDASTNFFFDRIRKGAYVFEYTLFVTHTGNFSNGVTNIQCMYAPEFSSHSEGIRINVE